MTGFYKQVKFIDKTVSPKEQEILGGIAAYQQEDENDEPKLLFVICGCCGGTFEPDEVEIITVYHHWINLTETIIGDE